MNCSRCGSAEAVVKREAAFYCGKCALARDWEEVILLVQEERVQVRETAPADGTPDEDSDPIAAGAGAAGDLPADPFA